MTDSQLIHITNYVKESCLVAYLNKFGKDIVINQVQTKAIIKIPRFHENQIIELKFINSLAEAIKDALHLTEINVYLNN